MKSWFHYSLLGSLRIQIIVSHYPNLLMLGTFNGNVLITLAGSDNHKQLFELNENR